MPTPDRSDPVRSSDFPRPTPAKAGARRSDAGPMSDQAPTGAPHSPANGHQAAPTPTIGSVVKATVVQHYGSVQEAAYRLGEGAGRAPLDPSLMMREFEAGKLTRLEADPTAKAVVACALHAAFVPADPRTRARQILRDTYTRLLELDQIIGDQIGEVA